MSDPVILEAGTLLCAHPDLELDSGVIMGEAKGQKRWMVQLRVRCRSCKRPFVPDTAVAPSINDGQLLACFKPVETRLVLPEVKGGQ